MSAGILAALHLAKLKDVFNRSSRPMRPLAALGESAERKDISGLKSAIAVRLRHRRRNAVTRL